MLVPSPTEDVKALIGDKNADEVSDLSEAEGDINDDASSESSAEDEDDDHPNDATDVPNVLIQNKSIIGGKNHFVDLVDTKKHQDHQDFESLTSQTSLSEAKNDVAFFEEDYMRIERAVIELERQTATSTDEPEVSQHTIQRAAQQVVDEKLSPTNFIEEHTNLDDDSKPFRPIPAPRSR